MKSYTRYSYDNLSRPDSISHPDSRFTDFSYNSRVKTIRSGKNSSVQQHKITVNSLGETTISEDNDGNKVYNYYYSSGLPKEIVLNGGSVKTEMEYDIYGNRTQLTDPNAGTSYSVFDVFGQLRESKDANGNETLFDYDKLGRITSETLDGNTKTYRYDQDFVGAISAIAQTHPADSIQYDYDDLGRLVSTMEYFDGKQISNDFEYDFTGRLVKTTAPNGIDVLYHYNPTGNLHNIRALNKDLWTCTNVNNLGQITNYKLGSKSSVTSYDAYGMLQSQRFANAAKEYSYSWDDFNNLASRTDEDYDLKENFTYDELNRLILSKYYENEVEQADNMALEYDNSGMGNIQSKSDVSDKISYGEFGAGPNALTSLKNPASGFTPWPQHISYTAFNKVSTIIDTIENNDTIRLDLHYGFDNQRRKTILSKPGSGNKTKYFFGNYEIHTDDTGEKPFYS